MDTSWKILHLLGFSESHLKEKWSLFEAHRSSETFGKEEPDLLKVRVLFIHEVACFCSIPSAAFCGLEGRSRPSEPALDLTLDKRGSGGKSLCELTETLGAWTGSKLFCPDGGQEERTVCLEKPCRWLAESPWKRCPLWLAQESWGRGRLIPRHPGYLAFCERTQVTRSGSEGGSVHVSSTVILHWGSEWFNWWAL